MGKGWLDNYNDSKVSVPKGFEGEGYSTKGRNYSPAWGGQFQMGGKLKSSIPVIEDAGNYNEEGRWVPDWKTMTAQAKKLGAKKVKTKHGSLIVFNDNWEVVGVDDNPDAMQMGGYVYPVNYVPKAQMGASIPGAVGFSYARTQSPAPSNGPYAKKTKASAQDGAKVDMYGNPIIAIEKHDPNLDRSHYDPRLNIMTLGTDYDTWADKDKLRAHENFHAWQFNNDRDNFDIAHHTDQEQWARMQKKPQMMTTDEVWNNYYNRSNIEAAIDVANIMPYIPETQIIPEEVSKNKIFEKIVDNERYYNPNSLEGEAMFYENTGFFPRYGKKDLPSPKFKNGGWLDQYEEGGVIKDDLGQWAHPGEITEIDSNNITMEGVPYDVLGISDTGDTKLMKPGKNYKFKGKKVTEYPMAKNGLRQEQKGLVNLDQLTNFTNYNKPQPGGWLNKYN